MTFVSELEPKELWGHFDKILTIPRGSKNEQQMVDYIIEVAKKYNLNFKQDEVGNIVVQKPGTPGHESAATIILQSHLDMVNEKNSDVEHDFSKDPIKPRQEGEYLNATGTTLGSDNGIGVAAALAVMASNTIQHGPVELLFTIDEETGLTGAGDLASDMLEGRILINMDTEEEGALYVGCAGGAGINLKINLNYESIPAGHVGLEVTLAGLKGGHSGVDVHLQRGNATKLLSRALFAVGEKVEFKLASILGGNMHNAIPREAFAKIAVAENSKTAFENELKSQGDAIKAEFLFAEPTMALSVNDSAVNSVYNTQTQASVLNLINALPHGVLAMSYDIPDLVETSSNLASVKISGNEMVIHISNRSSVDSAIDAIQKRVKSIGLLGGAEVEELEGYPGWKPDLNSKVLQVAKEIHEGKLGSTPEIKAIHAGLECGIIGEKYPSMDMVSFGPQIEFPHSPDERVKIKSVGEFYQLLIGTIEKLA